MKSIIIRANGDERVISVNAETVGEVVSSSQFRSLFEVPAGSTLMKNNVATHNGAAVTSGDAISWTPPVGTKG